jgi:autotransporter-associated beta strand protein
MALGFSARAAVTVNGTVDADYGPAIAVQTNNTQFGDNANGDGTSSGGSELDAAYATIQGGNLFLMLTGNLQNNFNHLNIFIANARDGAGQSTINTQGTLGSMNGSKFSAGFKATYALDINGGGNAGSVNEFVDQYNLSDPNTQSAHRFLGGFAANDGGAHNLQGLTFSFTNTNTAGVVGGSVSAANQANASAVTTGLEIEIPLAALGSPHGNIQVLADINGGGNGFLSNQFLAGLPLPAVGNIGGGGTPYSGAGSSKFDLSGTANQWFNVAVSAPPTATYTAWTPAAGGSFGTGINWNGGAAPHLSGDTATFGTSATAPSTVTLDGNQTVGQIILLGSQKYTIAQGTSGTLSIDDTANASPNPFITAASGNHEISAPLSLANGVTLEAYGNSSLIVSGSIGGTGGITKSSAGSVILSGANTYSGNTTINAGTLELDNSNAASGGSIFIGDPSVDNQQATLNVGASGLTIGNPITVNSDGSGNTTSRLISGSFSSGTSTLSGNVNITAGLVLSANGGGTLALGGTVSGNGPLTKNGTGTVALSGNNSYTGTMAVHAGTLELDSNNAASNTNVFIGDGGSTGIPATLSIGTAGVTINNTLQTNVDQGGSNSLRSITGTYASGDAIVAGTININGGLTLGAANAGTTLTVTGQIQNGTDTNANARHALHVSGSGKVILTNTETNTGDTFVDFGTLELSPSSAIASANVAVAGGAQLNAYGSLPATVNVTANGPANFGVPLSVGAVTVQLGTLTIGAGTTSSITASVTAAAPKTLQVGTLTFAAPGTGKLDITNNILIAPGSAGDAENLIAGANHNVISSSITMSNGLALGYGVAASPANNFEIRTTLLGDTDLDGHVNVADLANLAGNFGVTAGATWLQGDLDYNGTVNVADLADLAGNFGKDLGPSSGTAGAALPAAAAAAGGAAVPEPTALGVVMLTTGGLLARRGRRQKL